MQIYKLAINYKNGTYAKPGKVSGIYDSDYEIIMSRLNSDSKNGIVKTMRPYGGPDKDRGDNQIEETGISINKKTISWDKIFHYCVRKYQGNTSIIIPNNNKNRSLVILGLAIHNAMDIFAHSSCTWNGKLIGHITDKEKDADNPDYYSNRVDCAVAVAKNILKKYSKEYEITASDFDFNSVYKPYGGGFSLIGYSEYMCQVSPSYYKSNMSTIDGMSTAIN